MLTDIALDAMGSDKAPDPEIRGAILACRQLPVRVHLVGREDELRSHLYDHLQGESLPIVIQHASETIGMDEKAANAVRNKRDSSMRVGLKLVREKTAAGFFTAGNTGAAMASAKMVLGALPGVGLLSIGEEETKGNDLTREAFPLLKSLPINFVGNVEGRDIFNGSCDVVVCDGFVGNVALKASEGLGRLVNDLLRESLTKTVTAQAGALLSRKALKEFKKSLDYREYGGAPLLGVRGVCIVGHGSSNDRAVYNGIRVAAEFAQAGMNEGLEREFASRPEPIVS